QKNDGLKSVLESSIFKLSRDDHLDEYQQVSPLFRTTADAPPFLIVHGDKDSLVPIEEARVFADELRQASNNPVAYAEISGGQHAFDMFPSIRSEHVKHGVERFLTWVYSNHLQSAEKT
ncbi:MAG: prolyl oligopeptidase family serine peptidase, partial [Pseudomonadales bacterium]|nr:prolyl oligopeptidase family serine peptidase [Pseudomonadales bacterium]